MSGKEKKQQKTTKKQKRLEDDSLKDTKTKPKPKTFYLKYLFLKRTYQQTSADSVKWNLLWAAFSYDCYQHQGPWQAAKAVVTTIKTKSSSALQLVQWMFCALRAEGISVTDFLLSRNYSLVWPVCGTIVS